MSHESLPNKKPRFLLRDLIWFLTLYAVLCGWWIDRAGIQRQLAASQNELQTVQSEVQRTRQLLEVVAKVLPSLAKRRNAADARESDQLGLGDRQREPMGAGIPSPTRNQAGE
jgi:hypothetical protein